MTRRLNILLFALLLSIVCHSAVVYHDDMIALIIEDIYSQLIEEGAEVDFQELEQELYAIHADPIDLNSATEDDLRRLPFLSQSQIDAILLLVYRQPLTSLYELRLVSELADYEIRNLLPFVVVRQVAADSLSWRSLWQHPRQELSLRLDARRIESNGADPFYTALRYQLKASPHLELGLSAERDTHEPWYVKGKTYGADFYGGFVQLKDLGCLRKLVIGDMRASFGQGLTLSNSLSYTSKIAYVQDNGYRREGIDRKLSTSEYDFMRGIGATLQWWKVQLSAMYSARKVDGNVVDGCFSSIQRTGYHRTESELNAKRSVWEQTAAVNVTLRLDKLHLGIVATYTDLSDTLAPTPEYYNTYYFRGTRQSSIGIHYQWRYRKVELFGELSAAQNTRWGVGNIIGLRLSPTSDISMVAIHRYYSPFFHSLHGQGLSSSTHRGGEHGMLVGADIRSLPHWQLSAYADVYRHTTPSYRQPAPATGYDVMATAQYSKTESLILRLRARSKGIADSYRHALRATLITPVGNWTNNAFAEVNIAQSADTLTPGTVIGDQVEYRFPCSLTLQLRAEGFYCPAWDNRVNLYENDMPYSFSIPAVYGIGARYYVNLRYHINDHFSLYLRASQTLQTDKWLDAHKQYRRTDTDIHAMLRVRW